ncbi:MAG: glycoside hydrolase family 127 protein [Clostridiales bacterium]|nr:glycoside hydrolase family 127 protein [Clostridiales bacterium]
MSIREIPLSKVRIMDAFWSPRQRLMTDVTIPYMEKILRDEVPGAEKSHAISNFRMAAGEETGEFYGMVFQDSDVAKWLEAAAYSLALKPDAELEARVDEVVALIGRCQQEDGYLNTYFTVKEPENRWANLLECHELYCAGHMIEAGVALHEAVGKDELLRICIRLADHICERFMRQEGIPGHQEIEIGLMRLYHVTGVVKYRDMALRFLDLRGQEPEWFIRHTPAHPGIHYGGYDILPGDTIYNQSNVPVREQTIARGHAVRQLYMLTAMADVAADTDDAQMRSACERLFDNITQKQMYVTGAVGSTPHHEAFTVDYDLPADRCYGETCASVAMIFFAHNMLLIKPDGRYTDLMELELYNAALAGMQLDGKRFFYVNPLSVDPAVSGVVPGYEHVLSQRPAWHACACCPPNLARLIASLGKYLWSETEDAVYSHLFIGNQVQTKFGTFRLETGYPWIGNVSYLLKECCSEPFTLGIHIPAHVKEYQIRINDEQMSVPVQNGYCLLYRAWQAGDRIEFLFAMPVRRIYAHPCVKDAAGKVALARGPFIYCLEEQDNGACLSGLLLPSESEVQALAYDDHLMNGIVLLETQGKRQAKADCTELYTTKERHLEPITLRAIPYYSWANREKGEMTVWIREQ